MRFAFSPVGSKVPVAFVDLVAVELSARLGSVDVVDWDCFVTCYISRWLQELPMGAYWLAWLLGTWLEQNDAASKM